MLRLGIYNEIIDGENAGEELKKYCKNVFKNMKEFISFVETNKVKNYEVMVYGTLSLLDSNLEELSYFIKDDEYSDPISITNFFRIDLIERFKSQGSEISEEEYKNAECYEAWDFAIAFEHSREKIKEILNK